MTSAAIVRLMPLVGQRDKHYRNLKGLGLEIGALHEPARLPDVCSVEYFDLRSREASARIFEEIDSEKIVEVQHVGDIDRRGLRRLRGGRYDFVIANHVIEHLANPIAFVEDVFGIVKPGGLVILSAPDKRFTFDRDRALTDFEHLERDYQRGCVEASDEHYLEFIEKVLPEGRGLEGEALQELLALVRLRREHVHVWDSLSFRDFMNRSLALLGLEAKLLSEETGEQTQVEYLGVWKKGLGSRWRRLLNFG